MNDQTRVVETNSRLLTVQAVAEMLDCSTRHVYRLSDAGKMPAPLKLGALVRWPQATIEQWIANGCKSVRAIAGKHFPK
jgi:excisionase family DNA binding protein